VSFPISAPALPNCVKLYKMKNPFTIKKGQMRIVIVNAISLIIFSFIFLSRKNYEFIIYIGVILFFLFLILYTNKKVNYPNNVLWGLTVWSVLHMAGGGIMVGSKVLYATMLYPIVSEPYNILKYDQVIHAYGFAVATLVAYTVIRPSLKKNFSWKSLSFVVVMAGIGLGATNEVVEFFATIILPETGVGGYVNTGLDLVANMIGAFFAMGYVILKERKNEKIESPKKPG
jgi:uncharacterized membrane protein YjdF